MDICTKFRRSAIATAVCVALMAPQASLGGVTPITAIDAVEQQVNASTLATWKPAVASDADGDFVVAWSSGPSASPCVTSVRKYNANGSPATAEITVSSFATGCYTPPDVAMDADGDFVVAWTDLNIGGLTSYFDVVAQRFDSAGIPQGGLMEVATSAAAESDARVSMDADGDFALVWREIDGTSTIQLQRYDSSGVASGLQQMVNTVSGTMSSNEPDIAMDADGDLVVAWEELNNFLYARRYPLVGTPSTPITVPQSSGQVAQPRVAMDADGDFVVSWTDVTYPAFRLRAFASDGTAGTQQTVPGCSTDTRGDVTMDADGDIAVTCGYATGTAGASLTYVFRYDQAALLVDGNPVNSIVDGGWKSSTIAMDADGDMVVVWEPDVDSVNNNTYFRRYQGTEDVNLAITTSATPNPAPAGGALTYTATVTNNHDIVATGTTVSQNLYFGEVGSATAVDVSDTLPAGTSYVSASGTSWSCSETTGTVSCSLAGGLLPTNNSSVDITVTAPATPATLSNTASVTANQLDTVTTNNSDTLTTPMCNDYGSLALSAATASVAEDGASVTFSVSRSGGSCDAVSVDYATADGTATAGADYTATSGTLSWVAGDSANKSVTVPISEDTAVEGDEQFALALSNPSLATLGSPSGADVTITDNDVATTDPTTDPIVTSSGGGGGGAADPWWLALLSLPLLRRRRR